MRAKVELFNVPQDSPMLAVQVVHIRKARLDAGPFTCLQAVRQPHFSDMPFEDLPGAKEYLAMVPIYTARLSDLFRDGAGVGPVDAILSPPSSRPELSNPYRRCISDKQPLACDLTHSFQRAKDAPRAADGATLQKVVDSLAYSPCNKEPSFKRIVIVDDVLKSGVTVAAIVHHLRTIGLPPSCEVFVVCPLWLDGDVGATDLSGRS